MHKLTGQFLERIAAITDSADHKFQIDQQIMEKFTNSFMVHGSWSNVMSLPVCRKKSSCAHHLNSLVNTQNQHIYWRKKS